MDEHYSSAADAYAKSKSVADCERNIDIFAFARRIDISIGRARGDIRVPAAERIAEIIYG
jgi:hypothetical protein